MDAEALTITLGADGDLGARYSASAPVLGADGEAIAEAAGPAAMPRLYSREHLDALRAHAERHPDVPMLELRWPALGQARAKALAQGAVTGAVAGAVTGADVASLMRRFHCGVAPDGDAVLDAVLEADRNASALRSALRETEQRRLGQLQSACPAYFAPRGTKRRRLHWLHRRRTIRGTEEACADLQIS
jgi:hypothetical protein